MLPPVFEQLDLDLAVDAELFVVALHEEVSELLDPLGRSARRPQRLLEVVLRIDGDIREIVVDGAFVDAALGLGAGALGLALVDFLKSVHVR